MDPAYFFTLSHKLNDSWKRVTELKMYVLIFCVNLSDKFIILRRFELDTVINVHRPLIKTPFNLVRF
jgi:hypothetical protein